MPWVEGRGSTGVVGAGRTVVLLGLGRDFETRLLFSGGSAGVDWRGNVCVASIGGGDREHGTRETGFPKFNSLHVLTPISYSRVTLPPFAVSIVCIAPCVTMHLSDHFANPVYSGPSQA